MHARIHHTVWGHGPDSSRAAHGMRLASGRNSVESARTSWMAGACPSTLLVPARGRPSRLDANERAAAKDRMADQRRAKAEDSNIATILVQTRAPRENTHPACAGGRLRVIVIPLPHFLLYLADMMRWSQQRGNSKHRSFGQRYLGDIYVVTMPAKISSARTGRLAGELRLMAPLASYLTCSILLLFCVLCYSRMCVLAVCSAPLRAPECQGYVRTST